MGLSIKAAIASFPEMNTDFFNIFNNVKPHVDQTALDHENRVQPMPVDPLALVLHWRGETTYKNNPKLLNKEIYEALEYKDGVSEKNYPVVDQRYIDQAEKINRHFRNKLLMTGLKGQDLSSFRVALMDHLENPLNLANKHIKILLRLPDFYQEDIFMQDLQDKYNSVDFHGSETLDIDVDYVGSIDRVVSRLPHVRHYFKTPDNNLLCFIVSDENALKPLVKLITHPDRTMKFRGHAVVQHTKGYPNFRFYMIGNNNYEFY